MFVDFFESFYVIQKTFHLHLFSILSSFQYSCTHSFYFIWFFFLCLFLVTHLPIWRSFSFSCFKYFISLYFLLQLLMKKCLFQINILTLLFFLSQSIFISFSLILVLIFFLKLYHILSFFLNFTSLLLFHFSFPSFLFCQSHSFFFIFVSDPLFYLVCFSQSIFIFTIPLYFLSGYPLLLFFVVITAMIISDFFFHPYNRFIFVLFFHVWFLICCLSYSPLNRLRFFAAWHFFELSFSV